MEILENICQLFNIKNPKGYSKDIIEEVKQQFGNIPTLLEEFYLKYALSEEIKHLQDNFILPYKIKRFNNYDYFL